MGRLVRIFDFCDKQRPFSASVPSKPVSGVSRRDDFTVYQIVNTANYLIADTVGSTAVEGLITCGGEREKRCEVTDKYTRCGFRNMTPVSENDNLTKNKCFIRSAIKVIIGA